MTTPMFSSPQKNNPSPSRSSLAMSQWVTYLVKSSRLYKEQQRIVDIFIYLIYATLIHKNDISKANTTKKSIDITDGVVMTDLLNRAKNLHSGVPIPKAQDRQLFLLKSREEIITSYLNDCRAVINFDEQSFTSDQFIEGKVPKHVLIEHFFSLYREVFQKHLPGLPSFQFQHIFKGNGSSDDRDITNQLEMEQIQDAIKQVLFKEQDSDDNKGEKRQQQQQQQSSTADRFTVATNSDPKYKYLQRDRLLKRMDKFHSVLNDEKPLLMFNKQSMDCQRLHIDEFDQYYQRVIGIQKEIQKAKSVVNKKDKQIHLLREIIQNQTKVLENLDFDVGLLSNENVIKARIAAKEMLDSRSKIDPNGLSGTSRIIKNNDKKTILEQSMKSNKDVVNESRRLSKQIKLLQFNVEKQMKDGMDDDIVRNKRADSGNISQQDSSFLDDSRERRHKVETNDFEVQVNMTDNGTPQFEKGSNNKEDIEAQFMLQPPPTSNNYNSDLSQQIKSVDLHEVPDGLVTSFDEEGNPKYTSSQLIDKMGRKKQASNDWMVEKWKEISEKLMKQKEEIQKEHQELKERLEKYNRNSIDFSKIKGLQIRSAEFEMKFRKRDEQYSLLLSESTRMRNELDEALRINRPLANQLEQASQEIRQLREQNRQYRTQLLEMKINSQSNSGGARDEQAEKEESRKNQQEATKLRENIKQVMENDTNSSNKYIKVLLGMMETRVKELEEKNSILKQTVKRVTTKNMNKIPNRFS